jgi:hypothetical protein
MVRSGSTWTDITHADDIDLEKQGLCVQSGSQRDQPIFLGGCGGTTLGTAQPAANAGDESHASHVEKL